ncbi:MAG: ABC transporter permease, partial [Rhodoferax sp.]
LLMFLTPIFYPATAVPRYLKFWFELNPIGWGAQALRSLLLEASLPSLNMLWLHGATSIVLWLLARAAFTRLEKGFADVL